MKQWKRGASLLLALCLIVNQCAMTAFAVPSAELSYTAVVSDDYTTGDGIKTVRRGDTVEFSLRIDETDTNAYRGVYTVISFDPSALSYVENSLEPGPEGAAEKFALVSAGDDLTTSGTLRFAAVHSEDQTSGTVYAKFTLKVTDTAAVGVYPITIARADVTSYDDVTFDADGNLHGTNAGMDLAAITATKVNDAVRIVAPAEVTPPKKDDKDTGGPVSPSVSGVDRLLNTDDHIHFIEGYEDGSVRPERNISRAETAMMLYRLLRDQNVTITQSFDDVADDMWYTEAVRKLASMGIILGYEDGSFRPNQPITRAEFTAMAARFAYATEGKMYFTDVGDGFWAYQQIIAASTYGWINGYEDETFRPQNAITRAEAAAVLNRMLGRKADMPYAMAHEDELVYFFDLRKDMWYYADMVEATNGHDHEGENSTEVWKKIRH